MDNDSGNIHSAPFPMVQQHWKRYLWNVKEALLVYYFWCKNIKCPQMLKIGVTAVGVPLSLFTKSFRLEEMS